MHIIAQYVNHLKRNAGQFIYVTIDGRIFLMAIKLVCRKRIKYTMHAKNKILVYTFRSI